MYVSICSRGLEKFLPLGQEVFQRKSRGISSATLSNSMLLLASAFGYE
jgi:hypothetical protein